MPSTSVNERINIQKHPSWDEVYKNEKMTELPWYVKELDADLALELTTRKLHAGTFIDIGTGPGTQALELEKMGFQVTGVDISSTAIEKAKSLPSSVRFLTHNILDTPLPEKFDYAFDRGCFHGIPPEQREIYVERVANVCNQLFLKCFSNRQEAWDHGPHRFSIEEIISIFKQKFIILSYIHTEYQGTLEIPPKALFVVLQKICD